MAANSREQYRPAEQTPDEKLASAVSEKVSQHLLDEAYTLLKTGVEASFATKNAEEKDAAWKTISEKLQKDGSLTKLSAPFLKDVTPLIDANHDNKIQKSELSPVANNAKNPFYKGMAKEMLGNFDLVASLHTEDGAIDKLELSAYSKRQFMPPRADFVDSLIKNIESKVNENPAEAVKVLQDSLSVRANMENRGERIETWTQVADQLKSHNLIGRMSMAFLTHNKEHFDTNKNNQFGRDEVKKYEASPSPVMREFAKYIGTEFDKISTVDYNSNEISKTEQAIYEQKQFK